MILALSKADSNETKRPMRRVEASGYIYLAPMYTDFYFVRDFFIAGLHIVRPVSSQYQIACCLSENSVEAPRLFKRPFPSKEISGFELF